MLLSALSGPRSQKRAAKLPIVDPRIKHYLTSLVIPNLGPLRVNSWSEVTQRHKRFLAGVVKNHALSGRFGGNKHLILRQLTKANHGGRLQVEFANTAGALH